MERYLVRIVTGLTVFAITGFALLAFLVPSSKAQSPTPQTTEQR